MTIEIIDKLSKILDETISQAVGNSPKNIFLFDPPNYANVGDQAIFLGQLSFIERNYPKSAVRMTSYSSYNSTFDKEILDSDVILIQGGGNFGDLHRYIHESRLKILNKFSDRKIIQFPESIHFNDKDLLEETKRTIGKCRSFTLLVRDLKSLKFAQENFECESVICPDMAFALGPLSPSEPVVDVACLLRTDNEVLQNKIHDIRQFLEAAQIRYEIDDWIERKPGIRYLHSMLYRSANIPGIRGAKFQLPIANPVYKIFAKSRLNRGVAFLSSGNCVATDRLHGLILATLVGRERFVFDSLDGKVRAFADAWLSEDKGLHIMHNTEEFKSAITARMSIGK